jgi:hypothetical protein
VTAAAERAVTFGRARVEFDPDVWLKAPDDPAENDGWLEAMVTVHSEAYRVEEGSPDADYLRRVLTEFVERDLGPCSRYLRLAAFGQSPLVATVAIVVGQPAAAVREAFERYDEGAHYYDPPRLEVVDDARALVRALRYLVGPDGTLTSSVRYHRRDEELETDVLVLCEGGDVIATALALGDLDDLARGAWLVDSEGARR